MKDIHTHILNNLDDGSKSLDESLAILKEASLQGITDIILTPHYIKNSIYSKNNQEKEKLFQQLKASSKSLGINLYLGNEIYIEQDLSSLIDCEVKTLNNSRYILIELPFNHEYPLLEEALSNLKEHNLIPIIAHPERYLTYYKNYAFFEKLSQSGCLLQANIGSIYGHYGRKPKKMLKGLLKRNLINFLASDIHHQSSNIYQKNIQSDLLKIVKNKQYVEDLLINNPDKVIKNEEVTGGNHHE